MKTHLIPGLSLIELLLVISIIGILTASVLPTITSFNQDQSLKQAADNISEEIKTLRDKALAGAVDDPNVTAKRVWWGFKCASNQYQLGQADIYTSAFTPVQIKNVSDLANLTVTCSLSPFYFKRLTGELYNQSGLVSGNLTVTISNGSASRIITVYKTGKIVVN